MWNRVVDEFGRSEELGLFLGIIGTKYPKIGFNLLIGSFSLSISLGVISSGEVDIVFKDTSKFLNKGRGELRASIRDDGVMESETFEYEMEKELHNSIGIYSLGTRAKNYPLSKNMVDHDHQGVKALRQREIGNEVNRVLFEGDGGRGGNRDKGW